MSATIKQGNGVTYHSTSAVESPRGVARGEGLYFANDLCVPCGRTIAKHHRSFLFSQSPADILAANGKTTAPPDQPWPGQEWRPSPDHPPIPGDWGPARVAYVLEGEATVQVHEGDDAGQWTPCFQYPVTRDGMPYSMWMCRREGSHDPCDEEFMLEIST